MDTVTRVVKCSLQAFCKDEELQKMISKKAVEMHRAAVETMHLMGLDLRSKYEEALLQHKAPEECCWTKERVRQYFMCVTSTTEDKTVKSVPPRLYTLRDTYYTPLRTTAGLSLEQRSLPGNSVQETCKNIATSVVTNIKEHFFARQLAYIRVRDGLDKQSARVRQKEINMQTGPTTDDSLPPTIDKSVPYDLEANPERFLYPMWKMNLLFAQKGRRTFAILPLSKGFVPSSVLHIDTDALKAIAGNNEKSNQFKQLLKNKKSTGQKSVPSNGPLTANKISKMTVEQLKTELKAQRIGGYQKLKKAELRNKLTQIVQPISQPIAAEIATPNQRKERKEEKSDTDNDCKIHTTKEQKKRKAPGRNSEPKALDEKDVLWDAYFDIRHILRDSQLRRGIRFGHHITTDGVSVSVAVLYPTKTKEVEHKTKRKKKSEKKVYAPKHSLDEEEFLKDLQTRTIVGVDPGKHEIGIYWTVVDCTYL